MTNEMKLLTALCDALGFDVERECINQDEVDEHLDEVRTMKPYDPRKGIPVIIPVLPAYEYKLIKRPE